MSWLRSCVAVLLWFMSFFCMVGIVCPLCVCEIIFVSKFASFGEINLEKNKRMELCYLTFWEEEFDTWLETHVSFCGLRLSCSVGCHHPGEIVTNGIILVYGGSVLWTINLRWLKANFLVGTQGWGNDLTDLGVELLAVFSASCLSFEQGESCCWWLSYSTQVCWVLPS